MNAQVKGAASFEIPEGRTVTVAKTAGFCFGVERAVNQVYEQIKAVKEGKAEGPIYTYGPIIHNEEVVSDLEKKGVKVLETEEDLKNLTEGTVIIRSHGVPKYIYELLEERNISYVDVTCPFVLKIHRIVEKESAQGKHIVIVGDPNHPEVVGIKGWCQGKATIIKTKEDAKSFLAESGEKLCIVSQTTYNYNKFQYIVEIFEKKGYNDSVVNTICNATEERQRSAKAIAAEADVMIVIGGKHSSNSRKLYEICQRECVHTYFIQTLDDLHLDLPKAVRLVGITAGASTPNKLIEEVQNNVRINF